MQRASIKRSFNCEDLSSIDGLDNHLTRAMEAQGDSGHDENECYYSRKRRKAMSLDSSSWTTSIKSISQQQPSSVAASVSNDSITPKTTSTLASSTTTSCVATAAAITPDQEMTPSPSSSDELGSLPYFPSLRRNRSVSCDFPATAALDQMLLKHRGSPTNVMGKDDSSHSLEEREEDQWPSFQEEVDTKNFLPSPRRNVEDFAYMRRVSLSRPSSTASSSSCTLLHNNHPNSIIKSRSPPTVNQIAEALESLARI